MHQAFSPFVSTRLSARTSAGRRRPVRADASRRPVEVLENRVLFAAGDFDTTFGGGDGATLVAFAPSSSDYGASIAVLADGKSVVGGSVGNGSNTNDDFGLARLNADGSLDLSFGGGDGQATLDMGVGDAHLEAIAIAPDGKIVAVGKMDAASTWDWAVARFNADGSPDATFGGGDGFVTTDFFGFGDNAYGVDVQPDGKIVVTGVDTASTSDMAVVRYNVDGTYDTTFDGDGRVFVDFFGGVDFASNVKVQPDNKLIIVGGSVRPGSHRQFVLVRLNPNGSPDGTFGAGGLATADFGTSSFGKDVELTTDGKYLVGGWVAANATGADHLDMAVARFNANGSLDGAFGSGGLTTFPGTGGHVFSGYGLEVQQNGKVLLGGTTKDPNYETNLRTYAGVARLTANGVPDTTFGPDGLRQFTIPGTDLGTSNVHDLELGPDGSIFLAGYPFGTVGGTDFAVVKLQNDDGPPPQPGSIAGVVFNDANENGVRDLDEAGLSGWTVYQDLNGNGAFDAGAANVSSTDVPKTISSVGSVTVTSDLVVSNLGASISDLNVTLNVTHSYDDDLLITLISPSGQRVALVTRRGGGENDFNNTTLDDEAATSIAAGTAPFSGSFRPEQPLAALDGTNPNGTWKLEIVDEFTGDGGALNSWSLAVGTASEPSVTSGDDGSYLFPNLEAGTYTIREVVASGWTRTTPAAGSYVVDVASGQAVTGRDFGNVNRIIPSVVVDRLAFYNRSGFDGNDPTANAQDDGAIATNKVALLPGGTATGASVSGYARGLNGVMIDLTRLDNNLDADDFEFHYGNSGDPAQWAAAPAPLFVTERPSGRADGATRVSIVWADNAIRNAWLRVTVKANADTRLAAPDVFYFGSLPGFTGRRAAPSVTTTDLAATRRAAATRPGPVLVVNTYDHDRNGVIDATDVSVTRSNVLRRLTAIAPRGGEFELQEI